MTTITDCMDTMYEEMDTVAYHIETAMQAFKKFAAAANAMRGMVDDSNAPDALDKITNITDDVAWGGGITDGLIADIMGLIDTLANEDMDAMEAAAVA